MNQSAQAVENVLKGEKTFANVSFAVTGDLETDLIAGVLAVLDEAVKNNQNQPVYPTSGYSRMCQRICLYLAARYESYAVQREKQEESFQQMSQQAKQQWSASSGISIANNPNPNPNLAALSQYQPTNVWRKISPLDPANDKDGP